MAWYQPPDAQQDPSWLYANWDKILPLLQGGQRNVQGRGLDPSTNPDALYDAAFPASSAAKLRGSYGNDLLSAARMFLQGQTPAGPGSATPVPGFNIGEPGGASGAAGTGGGQPGTGPGSVTGFDPGLVGTGLGFVGMGATGPASMALSGLGLGAKAAGFLGAPSNLTAETDQVQPQPQLSLVAY